MSRAERRQAERAAAKAERGRAWTDRRIAHGTLPCGAGRVRYVLADPGEFPEEHGLWDAEDVAVGYMAGVESDVEVRDDGTLRPFLRLWSDGTEGRFVMGEWA